MNGTEARSTEAQPPRQRDQMPKWQQYLARLKYRVWSHYSGGTPKCSCCGETSMEFLCLDHINGGGNRHRQAAGLKSSSAFYRHIEDTGFPTGYRVLCHNCNSAYAWYGYCPHTSPEQSLATMKLAKTPTWIESFVPTPVDDRGGQ
jgi:hypothetical protein